MTEVRRYVVDASTAVKWYLIDEPHTQEALAILDDYRRGRITLLAPAQIQYEVPAALRRAVVRGRLDRGDARLLIESFQNLKISTVSSDSLVLIAYDSAFQYGCSFYDALYVGLAAAARCPLVCADRHLDNALRGQFRYSLWIEDYAPV